MTASFDAAVVGAGPAGAATAHLLARAGWSVALIERQAFPRRKVCGECVAASNLALLDVLGVGAGFERCAGRRAASRRADSRRRHGRRRAARRRRTGAPLGPRARPRAARHAARRRGRGGRRRPACSPASVQAIDGSPGAFRLRTASARAAPTATSTRAWSSPRTAHGSRCRAERAERREARAANDLFAFKANFRDAAMAADLLPVLAFAGGYGGMVVADDGLATLACCVARDRLQARAARSRARVPATSSRRCCGANARGVRDALAGAVRAGPWLASGPLGRASPRPGRRPLSRRQCGRRGASDRRRRHQHGAAVGVRPRGVDRAALVPPGRSRRPRRWRSDARSPAYEALWRRRFAASPARRCGLRARCDAAGAGARRVAAGAPLARRADRGRALERQDALRAGGRALGRDGMTAAVAGAVAAASEAVRRAPPLRSPRRAARARDRLDGGVPLLLRPQRFGFIRQNFHADPFWTVQRTCIVTLFMFCAGVGQAVASAQQPGLAALLAPLGADRGLRGAGDARLVADVPAELHQLRRAARHRADADRRCGSTARGGALAAGRSGWSRSLLPQRRADPFFDARWTNWVGLVTHKPVTEDYVPLLPWLGVCGGAWRRAVAARRIAAPGSPAPAARAAPLAALGRWSLTFYMVHQPVLIGCCSWWLRR